MSNQSSSRSWTVLILYYPNKTVKNFFGLFSKIYQIRAKTTENRDNQGEYQVLHPRKLAELYALLRLSFCVFSYYYPILQWYLVAYPALQPQNARLRRRRSQ